VQYLVGASDPTFAQQKWNVSSLQDLLDKECAALLLAWRYLGVMSVVKAAKSLQKEAQSRSFNEAWDTVSVFLIEMAKVYALVYTVNNFYSVLMQLRNSVSLALHSVLLRLFQLFALYHMQSYAANLLECGFITRTQNELVSKAIDSLCSTIRRDAVALVDAFLLPDWMLNSSLGIYSGDIYRCTFDRVNAEKRPPLPAYWEQEIKPLTNPTATTNHSQ
jgi:acyl-CoA oxidase